MVISPPFGRARGISPDVSARIARSRVVAGRGPRVSAVAERDHLASSHRLPLRLSV